jgi:hypothetical protein
VLTFGGGVNEVQRELIAMFGWACRRCRGDRVEHQRDHDWIMREAERIKALGETRPARARPGQPADRSTPGWTRSGRPTRGSRGDGAAGDGAGLDDARLRGTRGADDPLSQAMAMLDAAGFTSVLGTNCDQTYERYLRVGEQGLRDHAARGRRRAEADRGG